MFLRTDPRLDIEILNDEFARLTVRQDFDWSATDSTRARLVAFVMGEDGGFRFGDDFLGGFLSVPVTPERSSLTFSNVMPRDALDEDKGRGAIRRARRRRDRDEIYVMIRAESLDGGRVAPIERDRKSNVVTGNRF